MKKIFFFYTLLTMLVMTGCHSARQTALSAPVMLTNSDSVRIEYIETVRIDTITVEIPIPVESSRQVVRDSTSHLETSMAESDAWINPDGSLGHSIRNKDGNLNADVQVPVKDIQTNNSSVSVREVPVPYPEPVYVEKPLTLWQKFRLNSFWFLFVGISGSILYIFRKPLLRLMCRLKL